MSVKIDSPTDAYNFVKDKCSNWAVRAIEDPSTAIPAVTTVLGIIAFIVLLAIVLHNRRKMKQTTSIPKKRASASRKSAK